jgi:hypothetical protein
MRMTTITDPLPAQRLMEQELRAGSVCFAIRRDDDRLILVFGERFEQFALNDLLTETAADLVSAVRD